MKLQDLFESAAPNFGALQKAIYALVLDNIKGDAAAISAAKSMAGQTDNFWVHSFDDAFKSLSKKDLPFIVDDILQACSDVGTAIVDYFSDRNNFAPGEGRAKITFNEESITSKHALKLIDQVCPGLTKELSNVTVMRTAAAKKAGAEEKKKITPEVIADVAVFVKKYDAKSWAAFFSVIRVDRKNGRAARALRDFFPKGTAQKEFDAIDSATALKDFFKARPAQEYIQTVYDNLTNLTDAPDTAMVSCLYIISKDKTFSTALKGML